MKQSKTNVVTNKAGKQVFPWQRKALAVAVASCFAITPVYANPTGASVVNGQVDISQQGNVLSITNSPGAIINWQSFSIGANELTRFIQQSASSSVLNRVVGQDPSSILGALQSNGRVFLINPNGVLFGQGAVVDVAGLIVSTLNLSDADFLAGRLNFGGVSGAGDVINQGSITTPTGGRIYLVAPNVENSGIITSPQGDVILAAGNSVELVDSVNPALRVMMTAPEGRALNLGQIVAQSGRAGIYAGLIHQGGTVSADTAVIGENGQIVFKASRNITLDTGSVTSASGAAGGVRDGGEVRIVADGMLAMRSGSQVRVDGGVDGGNGGFLELSGKTGVSLRGVYTGHAQQAGYRNGSLLLDPLNINIVAGGSDPLNSSGHIAANSGTTNATFNVDPATLNGGWADVRLEAINDINIQSAVGNGNINNGTAGGSLTLTAGNDINVGAAIGSSSSRFNHDLTLNAGNNINVNSSVYLGNYALTLAADAAPNNDSIGNVNVHPGVTVDTLGAMNISGMDLTVGSGNHASMRTTVSAGGLLTINMNRNVGIYGGSASSGGSNRTLVQGGSVDLSGGNLQLQAGAVGGTYASGSNANAEIRSTTGNVDITLSGDLNVSGNNVGSYSFSSGAGPRSADAIIYSAQDLTIHSANSVTLNGASGSAWASGSGFPASGNATIEAVRDVTLTTTGALSLTGGIASIQGSGDGVYAHADAKIVSGQDIRITAGSLSLQGGSATTSINCCSGSVTASAEINATRSVLVKTDGAVNVAAGLASRSSGASGSAHASAKINAGSGNLTITGNTNTGIASLTLSGGNRNGGGGSSNSAAAQLHASSGTAIIDVVGNLDMTAGTPSAGAEIRAGGTQITVGGNLNMTANSSGYIGITCGNINVPCGNQTINVAGDLTLDAASGGASIHAHGGAQSVSVGNDLTLTGASNGAWIALDAAGGGSQTITVGRDLFVLSPGSDSNGGIRAMGGGNVDQTITVGRDLEVRSQVIGNSSGFADITLNAAGGTQAIAVTRNLTLNASGYSAEIAAQGGAGQTIDVGGNLIVNGVSDNAYISGANNQSISVAGDITLAAGSGDASINASGALQDIGAGGSLTLTGGGAWARAQIRNSLYGGAQHITVGGDLTLSGGSGSNAYARIAGNPDIGSAAQPVSVGGVIRLNNGTGSNARIESDQILSIYIHFPNLYAGGYFVNGVESVVADADTGFFTAGMAAILDGNLHITYGLLPSGSPPFDPSLLNPFVNMTNGINGAGPELTSNQEMNLINVLTSTNLPGAGDEGDVPPWLRKRNLGSCGWTSS
ncbi:MAG: filamentous hemagglutinin N-terminal domain-containing protein [Pseudomonadota bacterium]